MEITPAINQHELGRRLEQVREAAGLKQAELARRITWSPAVLSRVESGERELSPDELKTVMEAIETDQDLLWEAEQVNRSLIELRSDPNVRHAFEQRLSEYIDGISSGADLLPVWRLTIYIDREVAKRRQRPVRRRSGLSGGRKRVLVVPSVERDGTTPIDQGRWVDAALEMFGRVFGGATAYPKAKGVWRDDERDGALVKDEPVVVAWLHDAHRHRGLQKPGRTRELLQNDGPRRSSGRGWVGDWRRVFRDP